MKFAISPDGRLDVTAADLTGGGSIDVAFETEAVMGAEEVAERLDGAPADERVLTTSRQSPLDAVSGSTVE